MSDEKDVREKEISMNCFRGQPIFANFSKNLSAGLSVSLVNVPLSIALAVASSAPPIFGVVTAVWAGFLAATLGGSHYNIIGPTGALSGILSSFAIRYGTESLPILAVATGVLCAIVCIMNWDIYVRFLPGFVIHGFTLGVAFTIAGGQIAAACGLRGLTPHPEFHDNFVEAITHLGDLQWSSFALFASMWATLFTLVKLYPRIPWSIPLVFVGILLGYLSDNGLLGSANFLTLKDKYGDNALSFQLFNHQPFTTIPIGSLMNGAVSVAFVAVLETLISGRIADTMTHTAMNQRREVFGLAVANILTGFFGGMPATAALARTSMNIKNGAQTRLAGIICSLGTLAIVMLVLPVFSYLPLPAIAALLFQVAKGMVEVDHLKKYWRTDMVSFVMTWVVAGTCVYVDSTIGIVIGAIFGLLRFVKSVSSAHSDVFIQCADRGSLVVSSKALHRLENEAHRSSSLWTQFKVFFADPDSEPWTLSDLAQVSTINDRDPHVHAASESGQIVPVYRIHGKVTYVNLQEHHDFLQKLYSVASKQIILSLHYTYVLDVDGVEMLEEIDAMLKGAGKQMLLSDLHIHSSNLTQSEWFKKKEEAGEVFATTEEALGSIREDMKQQFRKRKGEVAPNVTSVQVHVRDDNSKRNYLSLNNEQSEQ